jgi:hypothetical protein
MRESFIGFRHPVRIFFLLDRVSAIVRGVKQFSRKFLFHGLLAAAA